MTTTSTDAIDGVIASLAIKAPCQAVSSANLTLEGEQTVNSIAVEEGDRVLVKDQTDQTENGIYIVSTSAWQRAPDFDGNRDVVQGTLVLVFNSLAQGVIYQVTTADPIVIGTSNITFDLDDDPSVTYPQTSDEVSAGKVPSNTSYPPGHWYRYGANTVPGTTDMTTPARDAHLSSLTPYAPGDDIKITGSIPLRANQRSVLDGTRIAITGNVQVFTATTINDFCISGDWQVIGDNDAAGSLSGTGAALVASDCMRWRVEGLTAKNIKGWGVYDRPGGSTSNRAERGIVLGLIAVACFVGVEAEVATGAEYLQVTSPIITRCRTGIKVAAGNMNVTGGSLTDNTDNVHIVNGSNHAHGKFDGTDINHAVDYAVRAHDVTLGHNFIGCHVYQGDIWLDTSTGIYFRDCTIDAENYYFEGSSGGGFVNCTMPSSYANTINNDFNAAASYTVWQNCKKLDGTAFGTTYNGLRVRCALSGAITITAANLNAEQTVLLEDTSNESSNNTTQTLYDGYAAGTGLFTCRALGDGRVRVDVQLQITNNAADDAAMRSCYAYLQKNSSGVVWYFNNVRISTTKTHLTLHAVVDGMVLNDTLRFRIGSTVLLANSVDIAVTETNCVVEGL